MKVSKSGLQRITQEEGVVLHVYLDQVKKPTIGVGHLLTPAEKASGIFAAGITRDQAVELLRKDIATTENYIKKYVQVQLNQNQFDALASMIFNTGSGPIVTGTLGKLLNAGKFNQVPMEMMKWCHADGQVLEVLENRRRRESTLFKTPVEGEVTPTPSIPQPPLQVNHDVTIPDYEPSVPQDDEPIQLTPWQKIQNSFFKIFKR